MHLSVEPSAGIVLPLRPSLGAPLRQIGHAPVASPPNRFLLVLRSMFSQTSLAAKVVIGLSSNPCCVPGRSSRSSADFVLLRRCGEHKSKRGDGVDSTHYRAPENVL